MAPPLTSQQLKVLKLLIKQRNYQGRDGLWILVRSKYPNLKISRRQVMDFIKSSETHQLYRTKMKTKHSGATVLSEPNKCIATYYQFSEKRNCSL